jgi:MinD superfamily P-loop ATPase
MEIPFDRRIAEAYSRGELVVTALPEWKPKFVQLFEAIAAIVKHTGAKPE